MIILGAGLAGLGSGCLRYESYDRMCNQDTDCDMGTYCQDRACVPGCRADDECPSLEICQEHRCVEGCRTVADCGGTSLSQGTNTYSRACVANICLLRCAIDQLCRALGDTCIPGCPYGFSCNQSTQLCDKLDAGGP